jgi:hypothetical protein
MKRLGGYFSEKRVENAPRIDTNEHELSTNFSAPGARIFCHRGAEAQSGKRFIRKAGT